MLYLYWITHTGSHSYSCQDIAMTSIPCVQSNRHPSLNTNHGSKVIQGHQEFFHMRTSHLVPIRTIGPEQKPELVLTRLQERAQSYTHTHSETSSDEIKVKSGNHVFKLY